MRRNWRAMIIAKTRPMPERTVFSIKAQEIRGEIESLLPIFVMVLGDFGSWYFLLMLLPSITFKVNHHYVYTNQMRRERQIDIKSISANSKCEYCIELIKCHNYMHKIEST